MCDRKRQYAARCGKYAAESAGAGCLLLRRLLKHDATQRLTARDLDGKVSGMRCGQAMRCSYSA
jgi:hypothetical protein